MSVSKVEGRNEASLQHELFNVLGGGVLTVQWNVNLLRQQSEHVDEGTVHVECSSFLHIHIRKEPHAVDESRGPVSEELDVEAARDFCLIGNLR